MLLYSLHFYSNNSQLFFKAGEIPYGVTVKAVNDIGQEGQSNTTVFFTRENGKYPFLMIKYKYCNYDTFQFLLHQLTSVS